MPRVVPSQVVEVIDQLFPTVKDQADTPSGRFSLSRSRANELAAIVELVDQIPSELILLDSKTYTGFQLAVTAIKNTLPIWTLRDYGLERVHGYGNLNPVTLIRNALLKCPDEGISPQTSDLSFISDADVRTNLRLDISSSNQGIINGEWKASTILAGATIEALLLYILQNVQTNDSTKITDSINNLVSNLTLDSSPSNNIEKWSLHPLIEVARDLNLIKEETAIQARLARNFRNLIHPGVSVRKNQICNRGTALSALAALEHVIDDLS